MKKTKDVILDTALDLFNSQGLSQVSLRTIANKMGISQGNLNYHYKKREEIIENLYFQLVENIDKSFTTKNIATSNLQILLSVSDTIMINFYEYRFIFLDFVQIMREHDQIKAHYQKLTVGREIQCMQLLDALIKEGVLREPILVNEYNNLYKRIQILADFWISSAMTTSQKISKKSVGIYAEILHQNIFPYLTEEGRSVYKILISTSTI